MFWLTSFRRYRTCRSRVISTKGSIAESQGIGMRSALVRPGKHMQATEKSLVSGNHAFYFILQSTSHQQSIGGS